MLGQSINGFQLSRASCSRFLDSRELAIASSRAALLSKEEHVFREPERYHNTSNPQVKEAWPLSGLSVRGMSILRGSNDAACVEQLLVHCAAALQGNDTTFAQQIMWVLNNIACIDGDPNQRVAAWFLRALVSRASRMLPAIISPSARNLHFLPGAEACENNRNLGNKGNDRLLSPTQLAKFVDLTPWHRFGFSASNAAILQALQERDRLHILDFSISHCMQWPTLIEAFSNRPQGPPQSIRLSVLASRPPVPPFVDMSYEELGNRLCMFARSKGVPLEFQIITGEAEHLEPCAFDLREDEALVVNCQMRLHYLSQDHNGGSPSSSPSAESGVVSDHDDPFCSNSRDDFLHMIRSLQPDVVTLVEEDADLTSQGLVERLKAAYNHLWIPFDLLESCLPRTHELRLQYEADVGRKIENILASEGEERIERLECRDHWIQRMHAAQFVQIGFNNEIANDVKSMLEQHATGWGLKREENSLLLTWKGHNVVFATAWTSAGM